MYLDPPYYHADQKRAYTKPFEEEDHKRLNKGIEKKPIFFFACPMTIARKYGNYIRGQILL